LGVVLVCRVRFRVPALVLVVADEDGRRESWPIPCAATYRDNGHSGLVVHPVIGIFGAACVAVESVDDAICLVERMRSILSKGAQASTITALVIAGGVPASESAVRVLRTFAPSALVVIALVSIVFTHGATLRRWLPNSRG